MKAREPQLEAADALIVGAGPAGLTAAIAAGERGRRAVVLEQLQRPGAKLLASGGGRCNLTNTLPPEDFMAGFGRQGRFMQPALAALDAAGLRRMLDRLGVATHAPDGLRVYPVSDAAVTVQAALWRRARAQGAQVRLGVRATGLWLEGGRLRGLRTTAGEVAAERVVVAAGGRGYPSLGGGTSGYHLARQAGHTIVEPTPALVPLVARDGWVRSCAGAAVAPARAWIAIPGRAAAGVTGDVLFTHRGVSGPAILDLSGDVAVLLGRQASVPLRLNLAPGTAAEEWRGRFQAWRVAEPRRAVVTLLDRHLPRSVAAAVAGLAGIGPTVRPTQAGARSLGRLATLLTCLPLEIVATEGWDHAMVTRGGVSLKEVDPRTLASRRLAGLFFAGEVLDLDGPSGGFNLQWAFSSGRLAGIAAAAFSAAEA
ncbi:MAG: aminoacetone oxidase family FAD-binding enzyme [Planctomycetes bacterium]|nr:aminoacetone oxidase family FAD-binding enzyme [Planctomycetota bacterium]